MKFSQKLSTSENLYPWTRRDPVCLRDKTTSSLSPTSIRGSDSEPNNLQFELRGLQCHLYAFHATSALIIRFLFFGKAEMLISIEEVAKTYLKVSRSTVYRLIKKGDLQMVHVRGCARVPLKSVERYVQRISAGF